MPTYVGQMTDLAAAGPLVPAQVLAPTALQVGHDEATASAPPAVPVVALIDTGASRSVIQTGIAQQLGLRPIGLSLIHSASSPNVECDEYLVHLALPGGIAVEITVLEMDLEEQHMQLLLGRDLLRHAVFVYTGTTNSFSLSV